MKKDTASLDFGQPLVDRRQDGKKIDWKYRREQADKMADSHQRINAKNPWFKGRESLLRACGTWLQFKRFEGGDMTLHKANFCKYRLCPICSWRRSLKMFGQASQVMASARDQGYEFVFVTLTVRNCHGDDLKVTLDRIFAGVRNFRLNHKWYKKAVKGAVVTYEITHNVDAGSKSFDTYHPHVHMIWAVRKSYFTSRYYVSRAKLQSAWRDTMSLDYDPQVWIERVKSRGQDADNGAIREISKYVVKPGDILTDDHGLTDRAVLLLDDVLHGRRLISYLGCLKTIKAELSLQDDDDLINTDQAGIDPDLDYILTTYCWHVGYKQYFKVEGKA